MPALPSSRFEYSASNEKEMLSAKCGKQLLEDMEYGSLYLTHTVLALCRANEPSLNSYLPVFLCFGTFFENLKSVDFFKNTKIVI